MIQFLSQAATLPPVVGLMIKSNGLIAWLHQSLSQELPPSDFNLTSCLHLLCVVLRSCFTQRSLLTPAIMDQFSSILSSAISQLEGLPITTPLWIQNVFLRILTLASDLAWISRERYKGGVIVLTAPQILILVRKYEEVSKFWTSAKPKAPVTKKSQKDTDDEKIPLGDPAAPFEEDPLVLKGS